MCCIYYKINIYWYQYEDSLVSPLLITHHPRDWWSSDVLLPLPNTSKCHQKTFQKRISQKWKCHPWWSLSLTHVWQGHVRLGLKSWWKSFYLHEGDFLDSLGITSVCQSVNKKEEVWKEIILFWYHVTSRSLWIFKQFWGGIILSECSMFPSSLVSRSRKCC